MKTNTNNNKIHSGKILLLILLMFIIKTTAMAAPDIELEKPTGTLTGEDSVMLSISADEDFIIEDLDFAENIVNDEIQVVDKSDKIIYSGSAKEWNNHTDKKMIIMKRKAELLFESNGTMIYKVF
ncbi:MAG: hypothetical protein WBA74_09420 [Cyclobacteriaceae bacterium]